MTTEEQINGLEEFIRSMETPESLIRVNKTKKDFTEKINGVLDYLRKGASICSPLQAKKNCTYLLGLSKIYLRSKGTNFNKLIEDIQNSDMLINGVEFEDPTPAPIEIIKKKKKLTPNLGSAPDKGGPKVSRIDLSKYRLKPDIVEKGDVVSLPVGPVDHYCLVCRVVDDRTYVIPITTQSSFKGLKVEKSRFFKGIAIFSILQYPTSMCTSRFIMPFDHKTEAAFLIRTVTEYLQNNVLPRSRKSNRSSCKATRVCRTKSSSHTKKA